MPELLFLSWKREEQFVGDDVLDPDKTRFGLVGVIYDTLVHVFGKVRAEMVRLHLASDVVGVEVEPAALHSRLTWMKGGSGDLSVFLQSSW